MTTDQPDVDEQRKRLSIDFYIKEYATYWQDGKLHQATIDDVLHVVNNLLIEAEERGYKAGYVEAEDDHAKITAQMVIEAENRGGVRTLKELWNAHTPGVVPEGWEPDTPILKDIKVRLTTEQEGE